jgi:hypothetical protein
MGKMPLSISEEQARRLNKKMWKTYKEAAERLMDQVFEWHGIQQYSEEGRCERAKPVKGERVE